MCLPPHWGYTVKTIVSSGHYFVPIQTLFTKMCPYWDKIVSRENYKLKIVAIATIFNSLYVYGTKSGLCCILRAIVMYPKGNCDTPNPHELVVLLDHEVCTLSCVMCTTCLIQNTHEIHENSKGWWSSKINLWTWQKCSICKFLYLKNLMMCMRMIASRL